MLDLGEHGPRPTLEASTLTWLSQLGGNGQLEVVPDDLLQSNEGILAGLRPVMVRTNAIQWIQCLSNVS